MKDLLIVTLLLLAGVASADDRRDAVDVVDAFTRALSAGDAKEALRWLSPDVLVYEAGHSESSREEYAAKHLEADIAFLRKASVERLERTVHGDAATAWVNSRLRMRGEKDGKPFDTVVAETMILARTSDGWRIRHIHWSSRPANPEKAGSSGINITLPVAPGE